MKQTEIGLIPDDWEVKKLSEIGTFCKGSGISREESNTGELPAIRYGELYTTHNDYIKSFKSHISNEVASKSRRLKQGDLLFTCSGETKEDIGKCVAFIGSERAYAGGDLLILSPTINIDSLFYGFLLNTNIAVKQKSAMAQGDAIVHISTESIGKVLVPLPPLAEQQRIAKALSDVDALIYTTEKLLQKKKNIKQGAMQELLTGKKRLPGFAKSTNYKQSELGLIPDDWEVKGFGDYASIVRGGSPRPIQNFLTTNSDGINWIKIGDVKPEDKYIVSTEEKIIPEGKSRSREVHKGDFILSNSMSFGRPYILQIDGCIHDGWLAIQNYQETFDSDFLYYLLGADEIFKQYIEMAAGSSVQNLNKEKVAKLLVPILNKNEQTAIAAILSDMDAELESLSAKLQKYSQLKTGMMQQLLTGKIRLK